MKFNKSRPTWIIKNGAVVFPLQTLTSSAIICQYLEHSEGVIAPCLVRVQSLPSPNCSLTLFEPGHLRVAGLGVGGGEGGESALAL